MNNLTKVLLILSAIVISLGGGLSFYYASQIYFADSLIFDDEQGLALGGYDPVTYIKQRRAVIGHKDFKLEWAGATWNFTSLANREDFAKSPDRFAPQYGGYDTLGIIKGYTRPSNPLIWEVKAGRLYLFYSAEGRTYWNQNLGENLLKANANWPNIRRQLEVIIEGS